MTEHIIINYPLLKFLRLDVLHSKETKSPLLCQSASVMINLFGKWMYAEGEDDAIPRQECSVIETREGDWLLVDIDLTNEEAILLKDYIVVPVSGKSEDGKISLPINAARKVFSKRNVQKSQKYFHGKMVTRMFPRKMVQPYKIECPLKYKPPAGDLLNTERLQQMDCWLEMPPIKLTRPLGSLGNIPASRVNVKRSVSYSTLCY